MLNDVAKSAMSVGVVALFTAVGLHNHWFTPDSGAFRSPEPTRAEVAAAPVSYAVNAASAAAPATRSAWGSVELTPDARSQYQADVEINGVRVRMLVDTGANVVALTAEDARTLNIDPPASAYTCRTQTANGVGACAPVRLRQARIGDITVYDVDAVVMQPGKLQTSLLGMSFLKKLSSFQNAYGRLVLKQ